MSIERKIVQSFQKLTFCALVLSSVGLISTLPLPASAQTAHNADTGGDEGQDWQAVQAVEAKFRADKVEDPKTQIAAWQKLLKERPKISPVMGCVVRRNIAELQRWPLKDLAAVKVTTDEALALYPGHPALSLVLEVQAHGLNDAGKFREVQELLDPQLPILFASGQHGHPYLMLTTSMSFHHLDDAMSRAGEGIDQKIRLNQRIVLLQRALWEMPVYFDDTHQGAGGWENGWIFERLVDALIEAERAPEALSYARLYFSACDFDKSSVERATRALGRAFAANDDFVALRAFNTAQQDEKVANSLANVKLPTIPKESAKIVAQRGEALIKKLASRSLDEGGIREIVGLFVAQERYKEAMDAARSLLREQPDSPAGARQVCRVFKAADASTRRSNHFLSYLNGQGKNPLTAFYEQQKTATASVGAPIR